MGSVKDIDVIREPNERELGVGMFEFSNRYSVFDWGEMPDEIPNKGAALCLMAAWNFEQAEAIGVKTHYICMTNPLGGGLIYTKTLHAPSDKMLVKLARVIKPPYGDGKYDYSPFTENRGRINNYVVPLENIYRRGAPPGSSLLKRIDELEKKGDSKELISLLSKYGLTKRPKPGSIFPKMGFDFTTKFEKRDRELSDSEAYRISGLTKEQFSDLNSAKEKIANMVSERARKVGLTDYDGKHEYVLHDRNILLADVAGTFDENRFMLDDMPVSKELLRQHMKTAQKEWYEDIKRAKKEAEEKKIENWKSLVRVKPKPLEPRLVALVGEMYSSGANRYTGLEIFKARPLEKVMKDLGGYGGW